MRINFIHVCEYAVFSADKKLNVLGIFDVITTKSFPTVHPQFSVVINIDNQIPESGLTLEILNPDNSVLLSSPIKPDPTQSNAQNINMIFILLGTIFPKEGDYKAVIKLGGQIISDELQSKITLRAV